MAWADVCAANAVNTSAEAGHARADAELCLQMLNCACRCLCYPE